MCRFGVKGFLIMLSVLIAAVGCRAVPIYNVTDRAIVASGGKPKTLEETKAAIVDAGRARGWSMSDKGPGHLEGTLRVRSHVAVVDIRYTTTNFSITYKDSQVLHYDGTKIHPNYNSWIQNLQGEIEKRL